MGAFKMEMKCSAALLRYRHRQSTIQPQDSGIPEPTPTIPILPEGHVKIMEQV